MTISSLWKKILCLPICLAAQSDEFAWAEGTHWDSFQEEEILPLLKGIVILDDPSRVHSYGIKGVVGVRAEGIEIPGGVHELQQRLLPFFNNELDFQMINELKKCIFSYYQSKYRPFVTVGLPVQEVLDGVVQVVVIESKLGEVKSEGNEWFADGLFVKSFHVEQGDVLNIKAIKEDLEWLNLSPFHNTDAIFAPGEQIGTTDLILVTEDRFPVRVYVGADDTGNNATGNARGFTGFNWGNVFGLDQTLSYQFTTSRDLKDFLSHTAQYIAPLPWRHRLYVYGGYATFRPDITGFKSTGQSAQLSMRYKIPFSVYEDSNLELSWGTDYKFTNNNIAYEGGTTLPVIGQFVNLFQGILGISQGKKNRFLQWGYEFDFIFSPAEFLPHQSNSDYQALRYKAVNKYCYGKANFQGSWEWMSHGFLNFQFRGQLASANLLPSEQFGLGGYDTVRGYNEREVNADNAICLNLEIRLPSWSFAKYADDYPKGDQFTILGFLDYGFGQNHKPLPNEQKNYQLLGAGPGIRVSVSDYFSMRLDYGFRLLGIPSLEGKGSRFHFGAVFSF